MADFVDVKSPYTIGHSRGVAELAESGARPYGLDAADTALLRRAALVHDLGRLGVPNTVWDKPGPLTPAELERARMHVYLGERMLASSPALAPLAAVAVQHHERPRRKSGYPRGLTGADITPAGRLLAAADSYHALIESRARIDSAQERRAGGVRAPRRRAQRPHRRRCRRAPSSPRPGTRPAKRREWPAGLTTREVEILRLLARGQTNKQIARDLVISPKTASTHVEHIYTKLGVNNRALASLFAAKHGLITVDAA